MGVGAWGRGGKERGIGIELSQLVTIPAETQPVAERDLEIAATFQRTNHRLPVTNLFSRMVAESLKC